MSNGTGRRAFARSKWNVAGSFAEHLVQFIVFAFLASVLSVEDFGLVAFLNVLLELVWIFFATGLVHALIQMKEWDDRTASICFTANLLLALFFCAAMTFGIGALLDQHYKAGSSIVMGALSLSLIIDAARSIHVAKLWRDLAFDKLAWRGTVANLIGGAAAIGFAYAGYGVWTLVLHRLIVSSVSTASVWHICKWYPKIVLSAAVLRQLAPFSIRSTSSELLNVVSARATDLIVGLLLGPVSMALYRVASRCVEALVKIIIQPLQSASFPVLARIDDKDVLSRAVERLTGATVAIAFPALIGTAVAAPEIVLLFGAHYRESAPILSILAIAAMPAALVIYIQPALMATGQVGQVVRLQGVAATAKVALGFSTAWLGAVAAATGGAAAQLLLVPYFLLMGRKRLGAEPNTILANMAAPLFASAAMGLSLWVVRDALLDNLSALERFSITVPVGMALYGIFLFLFGRRFCKAMLAEVEPLLRKKRSAAPEASG